MEMTKELAVKMGEEMMEAAKVIAAKYGYGAKRGSGKYGTDEYKMNSITFYKSGNVGGGNSRYSGSDEEKMVRDFNMKKGQYGLGSVNVGDTYYDVRKGSDMKIVGWKSRNRKYPVLIECVADGSLYKITPQSLVNKF